MSKMTIKDLAAKTGYAVGTVSRALNNQPNVSQRAREAILAAAAEYDFQVNVNAKRLKQHNSNTIAVIVKGTGNELFARLVEAMQALFADTPYQMITEYIDEDSNEAAHAARLCQERKPLGIAFLGSSNRNFLQHFSQVDIPCVVITNNASELPFENLSSVSTDDDRAAYEAIKLLISMGHRRIAILGGNPVNSGPSRLRYEGCMRAFREYGIAFDPERDYVGGRYSWPDGYQAANTLLATGRGHTAIFAIADVVAVGAMRSLWEHGLHVPQDVSIIGVDGLTLGSYLVPQLATIEQDVQTLAQRGVALLLDAVENGSGSSHELIPFRLLPRESIRDIRTQGE